MTALMPSAPPWTLESLHLCPCEALCRWAQTKTRERCVFVCVGVGVYVCVTGGRINKRNAGSVSFSTRGTTQACGILFPPSSSYVVDVHFYMKYLLVQHCQELSCSTKVLPSVSGKQKGGDFGEFCRSFRGKSDERDPCGTALRNNGQQSLPVWTQICRIRLALPILPHQGSPKTCCSELSSSFRHGGGGPRGLPQTSVGLSRIVVLPPIYSNAF